MDVEAYMRQKLDGTFHTIDLTTGRTVETSVAVDYIPTHDRPQLSYDIVPDKPPAKPKAVVVPSEAAAPVKRRDDVPTLQEIFSTVGSALGVSQLDLISRRRKSHICEARQIFFWFARYYTAKSYPEIARFCGKRDHSTLVHGLQKIDRKYVHFHKRIEMVARQLGVDLPNKREAA